MTTATYDISHAHGKAPAFGRVAKKVMTYLWDGYVKAQTKRAESYITLYAPKSLTK